MRLDTATGETQTWAPGARCFCEELIFVAGPEGASKEDDGALLGMVFDAESQRSSLVVSTRPFPVPDQASCLCRHLAACMGSVSALGLGFNTRTQRPSLVVASGLVPGCVPDEGI